MKMKDKFVLTKNVRKFHTAIEHINHKMKGVERMALVFSNPGLGKTETALHYAANNGAVMIRTKKLMSGRWLLEEIVEELGASPAWKTKELFNQAISLLASKPRTVILDEVDYFTSDSRVIETLRDLHDIAKCPMVFIGMGQADKKLMRYPHLYDRFVEIVKFEKLDREDVVLMCKELSDYEFLPDAIDRIASESGGTIRKIITLIHRAEKSASANKAKTITAKDFK